MDNKNSFNMVVLLLTLGAVSGLVAAIELDVWWPIVAGPCFGGMMGIMHLALDTLLDVSSRRSEDNETCFEDLVDGKWFWWGKYPVRFDEKTSRGGIILSYTFHCPNHPNRKNDMIMIPKGEIKSLIPG
jgi:hypothetical protein